VNLVYMGITPDEDGWMCPLYGDTDNPGDCRYWNGSEWIPVRVAG